MREAEGLQMVRMRVCYGKPGADGRVVPLCQWSGAWSSGSSEWAAQQGPAAALGGAPEDGTFWMTFGDFIAGFTKVYVCRMYEDTSRATLAGEWTQASAGGCISRAPGTRWRCNPQYRLTVASKTSALLALAQPDAELDGNLDSDSYPHAIGLYLLKASSGEGAARRKRYLREEELLGCSRFGKSRQVGLSPYSSRGQVFDLSMPHPQVCFEAELEPGVEYIAVPCTYEPAVQMPFHLSAASPAGCILEPVRDNTMSRLAAPDLIDRHRYHHLLTRSLPHQPHPLPPSAPRLGRLARARLVWRVVGPGGHCGWMPKQPRDVGAEPAV